MRAALAVWLVALAGLAGCEAGPDTCSLTLGTVLPMQLVLRDSKLAVPATINQNGLMMMVDTGSQLTVVAEKVPGASDQTLREARLNGIGGSRGGEVARLHDIELGRLHGPIAAVASDFSPAMEARGISGVLGMDIMGAYDVDLDVSEGQLRLFSAQGSCRAPRALLGGTLYGVDELPGNPNETRAVVSVTIGGKTLTAMLDSGAVGVVLSRRAAETIGLTDAMMQGDRAISAFGIGQRKVSGRVHVLATLGLGDLVVQHVPALVLTEDFDPRVDVLLGLDLMKRIHFWLSNSSHRVVMQFPPQGSPAISN